jgi:hypothetical protein
VCVAVSERVWGYVRLSAQATMHTRFSLGTVPLVCVHMQRGIGAVRGQVLGSDGAARVPWTFRPQGLPGSAQGAGGGKDCGMGRGAKGKSQDIG